MISEEKVTIKILNQRKHDLSLSYVHNFALIFWAMFPEPVDFVD